MNETEYTLTLLWKVAIHTSIGCVAIMRALDEMIGNDHFDQEMVIDAKALAFGRCQDIQIEENARAWVGDL